MQGGGCRRWWVLNVADTVVDGEEVVWMAEEVGGEGN
jgi:hypothetical protein